jgi:ribonuclease VapC
VSGAAIDASALIAFLRSESGADIVERHLRKSLISALNLSEVFEKSLNLDRGTERVLALLNNWQVDIVPLDVEQAVVAAEIKRKIGKADVSFADRACLGLAVSRSIPAVTANHRWVGLGLEVEVILIREEAN